MARQNKMPPMNPTQKVTALHEWIAQQAQQDSLRLVTCGSESCGKSTLIERLLWESEQVRDNQLGTLHVGSEHHGTPANGIGWSLLTDGLVDERQQDITIDLAYSFFSTARRRFIAIDPPGNKQCTRNVLTGASTANVAILLIDASKGVRTQTRHHVNLLSLLGIRNVILAINKMDLVEYRREVFDSVLADFASTAKLLVITSLTAIPLSALKGDNITSRSANTPWYQGPTLIASLETMALDQPEDSKTVFPVQLVDQPNASFYRYRGTLASGQLAVGNKVRVTASGQTAIVTGLLTADGNLPVAGARDAITLLLDHDVDASRGDVISLADQPLEMTDQFEATLVWILDEPGLIGRTYELKLANQWTSASITAIKFRVDVNTQAHESCRQLGLNDIAVANLALSKPVVCEPYTDSKTLGGFILVDKFTHATVAAGMVRHNLRRAQNVHRQALSIAREDRERINGHKGKVIWFTGLSGSGKSTIANALEQELHAEGKHTYILDGDNIRQGLNRDLGFTDADRVENIRRVAEVAKLMMDAGLIVMTAFISPFRAERMMARELIGDENFIEIFVDTPLEVCEQRDPKGLYKKARNGQLPNMTGINSPYERPDRPDYVVPHENADLQTAIKSLIDFLRS